MKVCTDGRIWGQNNKLAGSHLGTLTGRQKWIKKGHNPNSIGKPFVKGIPHLWARGEKHPCWKGGISSLSNRIKTLPEYIQWRSDVLQRDKWTCQTCNERGGETKIEAHHIKPFSKIVKEYNLSTTMEAQMCKELWDLDNGITLCSKCHKLTKSYRRKGRR